MSRWGPTSPVLSVPGPEPGTRSLLDGQDPSLLRDLCTRAAVGPHGPAEGDDTHFGMLCGQRCARCAPASPLLRAPVGHQGVSPLPPWSCPYCPPRLSLLLHRPGRTILNFPSVVLSCEELSSSRTFLSQGRNLVSCLRTGFGNFFPGGLLQSISVQGGGLVSRCECLVSLLYQQSGMPLPLLALGSCRAGDQDTGAATFSKLSPRKAPVTRPSKAGS